MKDENNHSPYMSFPDAKRIYDLSEIVRSCNIQLSKSGRSLAGLCPFHKEKNASFHVYPQRYICFGCGKKGDIFDFIIEMGIEGINNPVGALQWLQGQPVSSFAKHNKNSISTRKTAKSPKEWTFVSPNTLMNCALHPIRHPQLWQYAKCRGIDAIKLCAMNPWMGPIKEQKVLTFPKWIRTHQLAKFAEIDDRFDPKGVCIDLKFRLLDSQIKDMWESESKLANDKRIWPLWKCIDDVSRWWLVKRQGIHIPWEWDDNPNHWDDNTKYRILVICEGPSDGLRLSTEISKSEHPKTYCWHVVSADTSTIWNPTAQIIRWNGDQKISLFDGFTDIVLLFDWDDAGNRATSWMIEHIRNLDIGIRIWRPELQNKDISEYFDSGGTISSLVFLISKSRSQG